MSGSSKGERKDLDAGIEEFDLKSPVFNLILLSDELIETRFLNRACAINGAIRPTFVAGRGTLHAHLEANGLSVLRRT